jgi:hypothetical protein
LDVVKDVYWIYPDAILELNEAGIPPHIIARCGGASKDVVDFLEEELRSTKAAMRAAEKTAAEAEASAEAAADEEDDDEEEEDDEDEDVEDDVEDKQLAIRENADTLDLFLALLCGFGVLLFAIMYANAVAA